MKKFRIYLLFFVYIFFFAGHFVFADVTPTVEPTPSSDLSTAIGANCGFANIEGSDKCCTDNNISESNIKEKAKEKASIGSAKDLVGQIPDVGIIKQVKLDKIFGKKCYMGDPVTNGTSCICKTVAVPTPLASLEKICNQYYVSSEKPEQIQKELEACINCAKGGEILTGLGCIPLNMSDFISRFILKTGVGLGGVFSLLCIIYSAFMIQTSQGNPEKIKKAQENLTSCIIGLILIIFSIFILKLIGVTILKIPGLS